MKIDGLEKTIKKIASFGDEAYKLIDSTTHITAQKIQLEAAQKAPRGLTGKLGQSGYVVKDNKSIFYTVGFAMSYAPYVEFGTGTFVEVPKGWEDIAMSFYVNGKGYMHPQPFFAPTVESNIIQYKKDLNNLLDKLTKKYSS